MEESERYSMVKNEELRKSVRDYLNEEAEHYHQLMIDKLTMEHQKD